MTTRHAIAHGDVLAVLRELPDNEFDGLLSDVPYGIRFLNKPWDCGVPSVEVWRECLRVLKPGAPVLSFGGPRTFHRIAINMEEAGLELRDCFCWLYAKGKPASTGQQHVPSELGDYNTCLKPAWEPVLLARKPMEGSLAENFAEYGVGALAIGACRIEGGRWPANVGFDEESAAMLDAQSGNRPSMPFKENTAEGAVLPFTKRTAGGYKENGGASRFFFCGKVSAKEREFGCEHLPLKSAAECTGRKEGSAGMKNSRAGAGRTGGYRNHHSTLKPISLCKWLATLIKPPTSNAVLLVPYSGAGSEMIGALQAGWPLVFGIEGEKDYCTIAEARIAAWLKEGKAA